MANSGFMILLIIIIILFVGLPIIFVVNSINKGKKDNIAALGRIPLSGPREACEDVICKPVCEDYIHNQPLYEQCIKDCFVSRYQNIENCCRGTCGTLPSTDRDECMEACMTPLFPAT